MTKYIGQQEEKEMSFIDHLEELRWHLVRSLIAVMVIAIAAFISKDFVFTQVIFAPARSDFWTFKMLCKLGEQINSAVLCIGEIPVKIQSRKMTGQFSMHITSSFVIGIIVAFPYIFWEIWRFISPGLYSNERKASRGAVFSVALLFTIGVLFGYYIMTPLAVNFLANYQVSLSHCGQLGIALVFPEAHPLGVDIETVSEDRHETLENVASDHEKQLFGLVALSSLVGLTILWTAREALSKVLKTGLTVDFSVLEIDKMTQVHDGYELTFKNFAQYKAVSTVVGEFAVSIVLPRRTSASLAPVWHALHTELFQGRMPANPR